MESPLEQDQQQQQQEQMVGEAVLKAAHSQPDLNTFVRTNIHFIVMFAIVAFLILRRARIWYLDYSSRQQVLSAANSTNRTADAMINDGIAQARAKQMLAAQEAAKRDKELKEQRRLEDIAERDRRMHEAQEQQARLFGGEGKKANNNDNNNTDAPPRLPTLPSGRGYQPSDSWSSGGGGGGNYRPTGFRRPARGG